VYKAAGQREDEQLARLGRLGRGALGQGRFDLLDRLVGQRRLVFLVLRRGLAEAERQGEDERACIPLTPEVGRDIGTNRRGVGQVLGP
jgi:hypothetical protein